MFLYFIYFVSGTPCVAHSVLQGLHVRYYHYTIDDCMLTPVQISTKLVKGWIIAKPRQTALDKSHSTPLIQTTLF
jgi:hypothetical protein